MRLLFLALAFAMGGWLFLVSPAMSAGDDDGVGALGSKVLECYPEKDAAGRPVGDHFIIRRHSIYDDCRLFTFNFKVGEQEFSNTLVMEMGKKVRDDGLLKFKMFFVSYIEEQDRPGRLGFEVTTYQPHADADTGYVNAYTDVEDIDPTVGTLLRRFQGCHVAGVLRASFDSREACEERMRND